MCVEMVSKMMADAKCLNTTLYSASERFFTTMNAKMFSQVTVGRKYFRAAFTIERIAVVNPQMRFQPLHEIYSIY